MGAGLSCGGGAVVRGEALVRGGPRDFWLGPREFPDFRATFGLDILNKKTGSGPVFSESFFGNVHELQ